MSGAGWSTIESDPGVFTVSPGSLRRTKPPLRRTKLSLRHTTLTSGPDLFPLLLAVTWQALAHDFGVRGAQIEEIVTMDDSEFSNLAPVYGLIFLFKWTQEMAQAHKTSSNCASAFSS
jgi:hypothetical protein